MKAIKYPNKPVYFIGFKAISMAATAVVTLGLVAMPVAIDSPFDPDSQSAQAKNENSNGGGKDNKGKAKSADAKANKGNKGKKGGESDTGETVATLSDEETEALLSGDKGWKASDVDWDNHGHRVSTMVKLAKEMGYSASVGAMQGNFGTPYELDEEMLADLEGPDGETLADLQVELQILLTANEPNQDEIDAKRKEISDLLETLNDTNAEDLENMKPGDGPTSGWETTNLDFNGDGIVNEQDLVDARAANEEDDEVVDEPVEATN